MLDEKDFDELGKRLYDLEADPPEKGWDKIGALINATPPSGRSSSFRKNWWIPLVLLVPLAGYVSYEYNLESTEPLSAGTSLAHVVLEADDEVGNETESPAVKLDEKVESGNTIVRQDPKPRTNDSVGSNEHGVKTQNSSRKRYSDSNGSKKETELRSLESRSLNDNSLSKVESVQKLANNAATVAEQNRVVLETQQRNVSEDAKQEEGSSIATRDNAPSTPALSQNDQSNLSSNSAEQTQIDSLTTTETRAKSDEDTDSVRVRISDKKETKSKRWRLTSAINANYNIQNAKPVVDDEVLVTRLDNHTPYRQRMSYAFMAGVGKEVVPNLFVDAQLSLSRYSEKLAYAYATGMDSLIARSTGDGTVQLTPVYQEAEVEIANTLTYGGARLGATWYFWQSKRHSLNITASAGMSFLLSSTTRERIDDQWRETGTTSRDKRNVNLMIGAGYAFEIGNRWELMINPTFSHNLGNKEATRRPVTLSPRSMGLTFMISRYLGK